MANEANSHGHGKRGLSVVVLAAGFATRLYPLTRDQAKPLLDVGGRPVLNRILERVLPLPGLDSCVVVTNARFHSSFQAWREDLPDSLGKQVPITLLNDGATENENRCGGLFDLLLGMREVHRHWPHNDVLVLAGDNLIEEDLSGFLRDFRELSEPLLLCRRIPGGMPPERHGEALVNTQGHITRFREKPLVPEGELAATCFTFLPPDTLEQLELYLDEGGERDAPGHFLAWLVPRRRVHARELQGRTFDIGNLESLAHARAIFAAK
ncbi:MAG: glucose-1-phosphate thymidylyltransferase [Planctomycetota bacterium]|jgi:glucose-1-phosphate thymidylyltransferase